MVKRLVFILFILPCLFCLTTCDLLVTVLSMSPFPGYLSQAVASVDMRDEVEPFIGDDGRYWWADIFVIEKSPDIEGVFLVVHKDFGGQWVYAFDTSLDLKDKYYMDDHSELHLVDNNGNFVVGNIAFDPVTLTSLGPIDTNAGGRFTFSDGTDNMELDSYYSDVDAKSVLTVRYGNWPLPWPPNAEATIRSYEKLWLRGLGYDSERGLVYLFLFSEDGRYLKVVETSIGDYPTLTSDILDYYTSSPPIDDVEEYYFDYTRKGFIGATRQRGYYKLFNLQGDVLKQFNLGIDDDRGFDFDISGEYYYVFDKDTYRLYKAKTGF
jgi:hypothetical protein